jgi:hypothetical protein
MFFSNRKAKELGLLPAEPVIITPDVDRPKSPWTPSYSVITQGPDLPGVSSETETVETITPRVVAEDVEKETDIQVPVTSQLSVRAKFILSLRELEIAFSKTLSTIDVDDALVQSDKFGSAADEVGRVCFRRRQR